MDFKKIKEEALKLKEKALKAWNEAFDSTAWKFRDSSFVLKGPEDLNNFVDMNKNKIIIFWKSDTEFYRKAVVIFPVIFTKAWTNNYKFRFFDVSDINSVPESFPLEELPTMFIIEDSEIIETISWEENVMKVVKKLGLDIEWVINKK